jgi:hypothetical protein
MRITNRAELHPWRLTGPGLVPVTPAISVTAPAPPGTAGPSARRHRHRSGQRSRRARAERRRAARAAARHDTPLDATTLAEGFPQGIYNAATAYTSSAGTDIAAYDDLPSYHLLAARRLIATDDESYHGSDNELPSATLHGYAEWDFSSVPDLVMFRWFLDAADYWFGYSDTSNTEDYDSARERFTATLVTWSMG